MRQGTRSLSVGVAALVSVLTVGCGDDKTTIVSGRHLITDVAVKDTTGTKTVPADGTDAAGNPITITVQGDEFLDRNVEVRLVEETAGTFEDPAVDSRVKQIRRTGQRYIAVPHTRINQSRLEFALPASPLVVDATTGERTGPVRVQVIQRNREADVVPTTTDDANRLVYVTSTALSGGLSGTLTLASEDSGAFTTLYPGQGGVRVVARLSNFTGEDVSISSVNSESINFSGANAQLLDFISHRFATSQVTIPNGEERTFNFFVAATEDLLGGGSVAGVVSFNAVGTNSKQNRGAEAGGSLFQTVTPLIRSFGGSVKSLNGGNAGNGGAFTISSNETFTLGAPATAVADPIVGATGFVDNTGAAPGNTILLVDDQAGDDVAPVTTGGTFTAVNRTFQVQSTGTGNGVLIVRVSGDLRLEGCTFNLDFANGGEDVTEVRFVVDGSITIVGTTFNFNGLNDSDDTFHAAGLTLISDAANGGTAQPVTLDTVTLNANGGSTVSVDGGAGGGLAIDGGATTVAGPGAGVVTLYAVTINARGGRSTLATSGSGGGLSIETNDSLVAVAGNCTFDLRGGGNLGPHTTAAGAGGAVAIAAGTGDVQYEATTEQDGGDLEGIFGSGSAGIGGSFSIAGGDVHVGSSSSAVVIRNGGSNATTGGFGHGAGGSAGAITITTNVDTTGDDGTVTLAAGSALVGIGGAADGSGDAGAGSTIAITGVSSTVSTFAGDIVASGGWVHSEMQQTGADAGAAGSITINLNGDVVTSGKLIARGGSVAAERGEPADHDVAATAGGTIEVDATASNGATQNLPNGSLVVTGLIDADGGVGDRLSGVGGTITLYADGEDATPNGLFLAQTGVLTARGGADLGGGAGGGGVITLEAHSGTAGTQDTRLGVAGTIMADGGAATDGAGNAVWGPAGSVTISSVDITNDGAVTIESTGVVTVRGDGTAGNEIAVNAGAGSASPLTIAGRLEVGETTMSDAGDVRSQLVVTGANGNVVLEQNGKLLGNRSIIHVLHDTTAANDVSMLISGLIENDHRDLDGSNGFQNGEIVLNSDADLTVANGFEITVDTTGRLVANAGTVAIRTNLVAGINGAIRLAGAIVADAFDNPVIGRGSDGSDGSENGGLVEIGNVAGGVDVTQTFSSEQGSISANGVNIDDVGYIGVGGTIQIYADQIDIDATGGSSSLALSANGGVGSGNAATNQVNGGGIQIVALDGNFTVDTSGAITADGGHRGDGGTIVLRNANAGAAIGSYTLAGSGAVSANAGANSAADANGLALNGGNGSEIVLEQLDTGTVTISKSLSANGGDNAGGPGGFGGLIELDVPNGATGGVSVTGSFSVNGGSSTYSAGQGGNGGYILFGSDLSGAPRATLDADLTFNGSTTMNANGGSGPVKGGDAGAIVVNVEEGSSNAVTIATGSSWWVSLAPGTGGAEGVLYVDHDVATAPAQPQIDPTDSNPVVITE